MYDFRLYAASQPDTPIDSVQVRRDLESAPVVLKEIADEVLRGNIDMAELSRFVAAVIPTCLQAQVSRAVPELGATRFPCYSGTLLSANSHTQSLPETLWDRPSELIGVDMNESVQLDLLRKLSKISREYEQFPTKRLGGRGVFISITFFDGADALVAYCMVRHFKPRLIIEIGGGFSSLVLGEAAAKNSSSALICIEPFPQDFLKRGFPGLHSLIEKRVEDVELEFFSQLGSGDILFIDSSHTIKIGGDVNYLFWKSYRDSSQVSLCTSTTFFFLSITVVIG